MLYVSLCAPAQEGVTHPSPVGDLTDKVAGLTFGTSVPGGFSSCEFSMGMPESLAFEWYATKLGYHIWIHDSASTAWEGRIDSIRMNQSGVTVSCMGYWSALTDRTVHQWWSDDTLKSWRHANVFWVTAGGLPVIAFSNPKFFVGQEGIMLVGLNAGETYYTDEGCGMVYVLPMPYPNYPEETFWQQPNHIRKVTFNFAAINSTWTDSTTTKMAVAVYATRDWRPGGTNWELMGGPYTTTTLVDLTLPRGMTAVLLRITPR